MPRERFTQAASVLNISQPAISCQALCSFFLLFFSFFYYFLAVPEEADALERTSISCFKRSISSNTAATSAFFAVRAVSHTDRHTTTGRRGFSDSVKSS